MKQAGKVRVDLAIAVGMVAAVLLMAGGYWWRGYGPMGRISGAGAKSVSFPVKWEFKEIGPVRGALALGEDGTLYAASEDGFLYALDGAGNLQWKFEMGPSISGPTIGADGTIHLTNKEEKIFAINRTGTQQWTAGGGPYADKRIGTIAGAVDQNYLYTPWRGGMRAIRLTTGVFSWSEGMGFGTNCSVSILPNGVIVYEGVGRVDALYDEGRTVWQYPAIDPPLTVDMLTRNGGHPPIGNFWLESGMAVGSDGTMYAGAGNSRMVALSAGGALLWEFKTKTRSINRAGPVIAADGTIYLGSGDGSLYALTGNGTQKWVVETGWPIAAAPMLAEDGTVYVVNDVALMAVSPEGKVITKVDVSAGGESAPTLGADGTIYVGTRGGKVVAFAGTHGALMKSAWPKFQGDEANSGRARPF